MAERPDIRLTPEEQAEFLRTTRKCALATVDKDGFPHVVAMTFHHRDGAYYMTSYGKAQKVLNIRRNPKVGIMVETGGSYAELKGIMVRGDCEVVDEPQRVNEIFSWLVEGRTTSRPTGSERSVPKRVVLKIIPHKMFTWDHSKLGGRY
ncbi:MAG: pyridoxamine 5'-phosphate oxidase family protein [Alphaproteobacteria bacterium]|nr:pyridoxamine 5'-phosphate oxidase family protein [Alphaproteobacteria bacterium]